jgi:hypothetical protein
MLNIEICRLCHKEYDGAVVQWNDEEEERVRKTGWLACPYGYQGYYEATTKVDGPPPHFCPYAPEQIVWKQELTS